MTAPRKLFTVGHWSVREGKEEEFIRAWSAFARWTAGQHPRGGTGYLLQDAQRPGAFISFGSWESADEVMAWRERAEFKAFAEQARTLCDLFQPGSYVLVATSGPEDAA